MYVVLLACKFSKKKTPLSGCVSLWIVKIPDWVTCFWQGTQGQRINPFRDQGMGKNSSPKKQTQDKLKINLIK